jgi:PGF-pre-PGF domain-containing protein
MKPNNHNPFFKCIALLVLFIVVTPALSMKNEAANDKTTADVQSRMAASESVPVIIIMKEQPSASIKSLSKGDAIASMKVQASGSQKSLKALLNEEKKKGNAKDAREFWIVNAIAVKASSGLIKKIAARDDVALVELDSELHIIGGLSVQVSQGQIDTATTAIKHINATDVWALGIDGTGINVSVLDTGIYKFHPDIAGRIVKEYDFANGDADASDDHGHGTHVAGTVAGNGSGGTTTGVAPNVSILAGKVCYGNGSCSISAILEGIQWSVGNYSDIISLSLGGKEESVAITSALTTAINAGVVVIAAAGNCGQPGNSNCPTSGDGTITYPAALENVIAVGATDINDVIAGFSSRGPTTDGRIKPDVSAPGVSINSLRHDSSGYRNDYSGTSMATPHVSGAAALLLHAANTLGISLTPSDIKTILKNTAVDLGMTGNDNTYGAGRIDVFAAIKSLDSNAPSVVSNPTSYPDGKPAAKNGDNITLNATITDSGFGVKNATVNVSSLNSSLPDIILTNVSGYWINNSVIVNTTTGTFFLNVSAYDNVTNLNNTVQLSVSVDNTPPVVIANPTTYESGWTAARNGTSITLNATITDTIAGVKNSTVNVSQINNSLGDIILTNTSGFWINSSVTLNATDGTYNLNITAYDNVSNVNDSVQLSVTVDTTPPLIQNTSSTPSQIEAGLDNSILSVNASDITSGVRNVTLNLSEINGSLIAGMQNNSGIWQLTVNSSIAGNFTFTANATDGAGNYNISTILLNVTDTTPPLIDSKVATPDSILADGIDSTTLSVTAHDFANVSNITSITVNLSIIGGNSSVNFTNNSGIWQTTTNVTATGLNGSLVRIPLNITDARNNSNISTYILLGIKLQVNTETAAGNRTVFNFTVDSSTFNTSFTIPASTSLTGSLLVAPVEIPALDGLKSTGFALNLTNLTFNKSIKLEMEYNSTYFNDTTNLSKLRLWHYNSTARNWEITENSSVDIANSTVSGNTSHFSVFAPMADTTPPNITNVTSSSVTTSSATITWDTDEASTSLVKYGTSSDAYSLNRSNTSNVTEHSISISGLSASTTYYYVVNSTDQSGNSAESTEKTSTTSSGGGDGDTGGGGGGGGGGGASGENFSNIEVKEKYDLHIFKDKVTSYMFSNTQNPVMFINITGNINAGEINTAVEVLRNTSTLVDKSAPGTVYKNVNIWVGTSGFANPRNIKEAVVKFRVENTWLTTRGFSPGDVVVYRWNGSDWNKLETYTAGGIGSYIVFEARTFEFSPFAFSATEQARSTAPAVYDRINVSSASPATDSTPESTQRRWLPGFTVIAALLVFAIISAMTLKRK